MSTFVLKKEYALQLPTSYVDIDTDEMEYIDGGISWSGAKNVLYGALGYFIGKIVGHAISKSLVGAAIKAAGGWLAGVIDTAIIAVYVHPWLAAGSIAAIGGCGYAVYRVGRKKRWW